MKNQQSKLNNHFFHVLIFILIFLGSYSRGQRDHSNNSGVAYSKYEKYGHFAKDCY